jgi:hypothetical protein
MNIFDKLTLVIMNSKGEYKCNPFSGTSSFTFKSNTDNMHLHICKTKQNLYEISISKYSITHLLTTEELERIYILCDRVHSQKMINPLDSFMEVKSE